MIGIQGRKPLGPSRTCTDMNSVKPRPSGVETITLTNLFLLRKMYYTTDGESELVNDANRLDNYSVKLPPSGVES